MAPAIAPADYADLVRLIHDRHGQMSKSYQKISLYLTQNPNAVAVLSVNFPVPEHDYSFSRSLPPNVPDTGAG